VAGDRSNLRARHSNIPRIVDTLGLSPQAAWNAKRGDSSAPVTQKATRNRGRDNDSGVIAGSYFYDWNNQIAEGFLRVPQP